MLQMRYIRNTEYAMSPIKTSTLNLRIDPRLKEALRIASEREHRSIANMVEILIRQHCTQVGISIPEQQEIFEQNWREELCNYFRRFKTGALLKASIH